MRILLISLIAFLYAYADNLKVLNPEEIGDIVNITLDNLPQLQNLPDIKEENSFYLQITPAERGEVQHKIDLFKRVAIKRIKRYLDRGKPYIPEIKSIFAKYNIPDDLIFLPIIESHFNVKAYSPAGAAGLWQFMPQTGRMYGLEINKWIDERLDVEKSTEAAALYLRDLYNIFDDWTLALASYNIGEGKIIRKINKYGGLNFWDINTYLPKETRNYVPNFIATVEIVKDLLNKEHFSYERRYFDVVKVKHPISLELVSVLLKVPYSKLKELNPHLKKGKTPPWDGEYNLYLPVGYGETLKLLLEDIKLQDFKALKEYRVKKGDTLIKIAKRFNTTVSFLKQVNNLDKGWILANTYIKVPSTIKAYPLYSDTVVDLSEDIQYTPKGIIYKVKKGDTLAKIAHRFRVSVAKIKRWNNINGYILPNQKIKIYKKVYLKNLATRFIKRNILYLKKRVKKRKPKYRYIFYTVKSGDSLLKIAKKYKVSVANLKKWNRIKGNLIRVGDRLTIVKRITQ